MSINEFLEYVDKRIKKIEEKDPDYLNNPNWVELRFKQDQAYRELAKTKLVYYEFLVNKYSNDQNRCENYKKKIKEYRKYLGMEEENANTL